MAFNVMGLGEDPDWVEEVKRTIESIERMENTVGLGGGSASAKPEEKPQDPESFAKMHLLAILESDLEWLGQTYADSVMLMPGHPLGGGAQPLTIERQRLLMQLRAKRGNVDPGFPEMIDQIMASVKCESLEVQVGDFEITPEATAGTPDGKLHFSIEEGDQIIRVGSKEEGEDDFLLFQVRRIEGDWRVIAEYRE